MLDLDVHLVWEKWRKLWTVLFRNVYPEPLHHKRRNARFGSDGLCYTPHVLLHELEVKVTGSYNMNPCLDHFVSV